MKTKYPLDLKKRQPEVNILLVLKNNEEGCEYSDLLMPQMKISEKSLVKYLRLLQSENYIKKEKINLEDSSTAPIFVYRITQYGVERLKTLKSLENEAIFPPEDMDLSYEEKIIWMVKKNEFCVWKNFMDERLKIPKTSLSEKLNNLTKKKKFIEKTIKDGNVMNVLIQKHVMKLKKF